MYVLHINSFMKRLKEAMALKEAHIITVKRDKKKRDKVSGSGPYTLLPAKDANPSNSAKQVLHI